MLKNFELFLKELSSEGITDGFVIALGLTFLFGLFFFIINGFKKEKSKKLATFTEYAPVLLTSLGILGTFTGIVAGLLNFDINSIDTSISSLLAGMKTAFLTSVIGVALSIILKLCYTFLTRNKKAENNNEMDIESVVNTFYQQTAYLKEQSEHFPEVVNALNTISKTLGNESESSLLGQTKLLRSDLSDANKALLTRIDAQQHCFNDFQENLWKHLSDANKDLLTKIDTQQQDFSDFQTKLWKQLQDFADMMSKSATEAVIEALKQVIMDFNHNLTEQFGDNFKQLNQAVLKLVDWQENYKNQLNEMITLYATGVQTLDQTSTAIEKIEQSSQKIPQTMEDLAEVIEVNQHQIKELSSHLDSFAELRDKAVAAIPATQNQIDLMLANVKEANTQLANTIAQSTETFIANTEKSSDTLAKAIQRSTEKFVENSEKSNLALVESGTKLETTSQSISAHQQNLNQLQQQAFDKTTQFMQSWQRDFDENVKRIQSQFTTSVEAAMQKQIEDSKKLMSKLEQESETALNRTGESVNKQIQALDKALEKELEQALSYMGQMLASITNRLAEDYNRLTNEIKTAAQQGSRGRF